MEKPKPKLRKYQVNDQVVLDGSQVKSFCLKKQDFFKRLSEEEKQTCRAQFAANFEFDGIDRESFLIPNTPEAQRTVMKILKSLGQ